MSTTNAKRFDEDLYYYELKPSKFRIISADIINFIVMVLMIIGMFSLANVDLRNHGQAAGFLVLTVILHFVINHALFCVFKWNSLGHFLMQTALVNGTFGRRLSGWDIFELGLKGIGYRFVYKNLYDTFYFFNSPLNQSIVMHKSNVFFVDHIKYRRMIKHGELLL